MLRHRVDLHRERLNRQLPQLDVSRPSSRSRSPVWPAQNSLSSKLITRPARRANHAVERPAPSSRIDQSERILRRSQPTAAGTIQGRSGVRPDLARNQAAG